MPSPRLRLPIHSPQAGPRPQSSSHSARDAQTIILPDGRTLGYAEYGSTKGTPLLYFHGFPTSRLDISGLDSMMSRRNIRLLALDRPGFGLSTYYPHRSITDWAVDVQAFANQVGLSRFTVLGISGGGPYALVCARLLPSEMLQGVGVLAGAPVWHRGFWTETPWFSKPLYLAAHYCPAVLRVVSSGFVRILEWAVSTELVKKKIDEWLESLPKASAEEEKKNDPEKIPLTATMDAVPEEDSEPQEPVRTTAQRRERLIRLLFEGFAQGTDGFVRETQLITHDWGFRFEDISYKIRMWHGTKDVNAPVANIRDMAARIPLCVLKEFDCDHYSIGDHFEEVFDELLPETATKVTG